MATDLITLHRDVRRALRDRLKTVTGYPGQGRVDWEGSAPVDPLGTAEWWRERLIPASSSGPTLGQYGRIRHTGTYLVDVFLPAGTGAKQSDLSSGNIMNAFPTSLQLQHNGRTVTIERTYRSNARITGLWLQVPVTMSWYVHSINTI